MEPPYQEEEQHQFAVKKGKNVRMRIEKETKPDEEPVNISVADLAHRMNQLDSWTFYGFGMRRSGKSFFLRWLLYYQTLLGKEYDAVFVFSGTAMNNQFDMVPRKFQWERWNDESARIVEEIFNRQKDIVQHNSECTEESEMRTVPSVLLIFDDVFHSGDGALFQGFKAEMMSKIWFQGRHYNISSALLAQAMKSMSRIRSNSDIVASFFPSSHIIRKELRDHHLTVESTTPESVRAAERFMMKTWNGKHACQIIDLADSAGKRSLGGFVYSCTAPADDPPKFGMGHEDMWKVEGTMV